MAIKTREETCAYCGKKFIFRIDEITERKHDDNFKPLCPECRVLKRKQAEEKRNREEREIRRKKADTEHKEFLKRLNAWKVISIDDVHPENENTLYIIGNGFDLMHCVSSSYYDFRDTLGKRSFLRFMFDNFITVDNMWADLESALAHFDVSAMTSEYVIDIWLDNFGVYDEDSGTAEYYMAVEAAATPIITIAEELPYRFRKWVNTLTIGTADRPLSNMFVNGKVLNFNYTEFVEELYGVSKENVCYIHGCRVKQKSKPREPLILGHLMGASDSLYDVEPPTDKYLSRFKRAYMEMAQSNVIDCISDYDESLTKDTEKIIEVHKQFFAGLSHIQTVIVIGHSFSEADWDYFFKIRRSIDHNARWYFGCYGLRDLDNLENLLPEIGLDKSCVFVFRIDCIATKPLFAPKKESVPRKRISKHLCKSKDGKWEVQKTENDLLIVNLIEQFADYAVNLSSGFKGAFFVSKDSCLLAVMYADILLFRNIDGHWRFIGELYCDHQHLLVSRLQRVLVTDSKITFVYNNRIRRYSLIDGTCISNKNIKGARNLSLNGEDITDMFLKIR